MKKASLLIAILLVFTSIALTRWGTQVVLAQVCWDQRVINQWRCSFVEEQLCPDANRRWTCSLDFSVYSGAGGESACNSACRDAYNVGTCTFYCSNWVVDQTASCVVEDFIAECTGESATPSCQANATIVSCQSQGASCTETQQQLVYGCWVTGTPTPPPGTPGPTANPSPTPTLPPLPPPGSFCGDGVCDVAEDTEPICCTTDCGSNICAPPPPTPSPSPDSQIQGSVYLDENREAVLIGDNCSILSAPKGFTGIQPGAGSNVTAAPDPNTAPVNTDGSWGPLIVPSNVSYNVTLNIGDPNTWICSCPAGCTYGVDTPPNATRDFFVTQARPAWLQTLGGDIHAETGGGSNAFGNPVPDCSGGCKPYTSLLDLSATTDSTGIFSFGSGDLDFWQDSGNQVRNIDEETKDRLVKSSTQEVIASYAWFYRLFELPLNPSDDFSTTANDAPKPTSPPLDSKTAYYRQGDLSITTQTWSVGAGENITVFVNGNLKLDGATDSQITSVAPGGFLAFVVSGNISFDSNIGNVAPANTTANIEGIFIADGTIDIQTKGDPTPDNKFVAQGSFIGLSGINPSRDFRSTDNNADPAELFSFRPDFVINAPIEFKKPNFTWQELAP